MRIVLDTNVIVSAFIKPEGSPGIILKEIFAKESHTLLLSKGIVDELRQTLTYSKIGRYISFSDHQINFWITSLEMIAQDVCLRFTYDPIVLEDPKDDIYIITAIEGHAECIVSGDNHLLNLNPYEGIPILKPSNFLKWADHLSQVSAYEFHEGRASLF